MNRSLVETNVTPVHMLQHSCVSLATGKFFFKTQIHYDVEKLFSKQFPLPIFVLFGDDNNSQRTITTFLVFCFRMETNKTANCKLYGHASSHMHRI